MPKFLEFYFARESLSSLICIYELKKLWNIDKIYQVFGRLNKYSAKKADLHTGYRFSIQKGVILWAVPTPK